MGLGFRDYGGLEFIGIRISGFRAEAVQLFSISGLHRWVKGFACSSFACLAPLCGAFCSAGSCRKAHLD